MKTALEKTIFVYENWRFDSPTLLGKLYIDNSKNRELYSFEYSDEWLETCGNNYTLDPELSLYKGRQYTRFGDRLFGLFSDSAPDRWGRMLMSRKEAITARNENRRPRALHESDYLLGVNDKSRMGALRFSLQDGGTFISGDESYSVPPWTSLRSLENASLEFENEDTGNEELWLSELLAPGSSLGGARPKANIVSPDGSLWIAKFPSRHDSFNSGAWEKVVHDLAGLCNLNKPESMLEDFPGNGSTFMVKRFDRNLQRRIHFASAMSLLGKTDGASGTDGTSYLEIADFISAYGANPIEDLKEMWMRIVFYMAISNTDDHLRNHGFILTPSGWMLSPLFDVNPNPAGRHLSLNITQYDNYIDLSLAIEVSPYFDIKKNDASKLSEEIIKTVSANWTKIAKRYGLGTKEIEYMRPAFSRVVQ
ncbi:MAG TPA: type II toxin-antitoxin system HipA family toxin [Clostridia bacterium]|nr:type II toxin-antitoxin system HipA family toxin [Clostridia bacterium]